MLFLTYLPIFWISTPTPIKMPSKLTNISKMVILGDIDVNERVSCDSYVGVRKVILEGEVSYLRGNNPKWIIFSEVPKNRKKIIKICALLVFRMYSMSPQLCTVLELWTSLYQNWGKIRRLTKWAKMGSKWPQKVWKSYFDFLI